MDEIKQPTTIANGGIMLLSADSKGEKEDEKNPGYVYYYYVNNCLLSGEETRSVRLIHYETKSSVISSSYRSDGGDSHVCIGSRYDRMDQVVLSSGTGYVSSGCVADNTSLLPYGCLIVHSGGTANKTMIEGGGLHVSNGGMASETTINSGGLILRSGTANKTTVNRGLLTVSSGGTANSVALVLGSATISRGGTVNSISVNPGCKLDICSGGTAMYIVENGGYVDVSSDAETVAVFVPNTFSELVLPSGAMATVHSGTISNDITLEYGGSLRVYSGGTVNKTMIEGGSLHVSNGGTANSTTVDGGSFRICSGGTANSTTVNSGGCYLSNTGTIANDTTINSGCSFFVYNGTIANRTTVNGGTVTISQGGLMTLCSASTLAFINNYGSIDFLVSSAPPDDQFLFGDYSRYSNSMSTTPSQYSITVIGSLEPGDYRLLALAQSFKYSVTVKDEGSNVLGTFVWDSTSGYNTLDIGGRQYTLKRIPRNNIQSDLVLTVAPGPTCLNYDFTDIGQTVYYDGPAQEVSGLTGTLMMIPFTADITMTFDKSLSSGDYQFTTSVAEVPGSVNICSVQIDNGEAFPELDDLEGEKRSVIYTSRDKCQRGTKIGETDTTVTYKFTDVNDYLLIDSIPDDTLDLDVAVCTANSEELVINASNGSASYYSGPFSDVNKRLVVGKISGSFKTKNGAYSFEIFAKDKSDELTDYNYDVNSYTYHAQYRKGLLFPDVQLIFPDVQLKIEGNQETALTFTITPVSDAYSAISIEVDCNTLKILSIKCSDVISSWNGIQVGETLKLDIDKKHDSYSLFAPRDDLHCWIAVAANMLGAAGYLSEDLTAKEFYEILSQNHSKKTSKHDTTIEGEGGNPTTIFAQYSIGFTGYYLRPECEKEEEKKNIFFAIDQGLAHLAKGDGKIIGAIGLEKKGGGHHIITCYKVTYTNQKYNEVIISYVDSDDPIDNISSSQVKQATFKKTGPDEWEEIDLYQGTWIIDGVITLISNSGNEKEEKKIKKSDLESYRPVAENKKIYAQKYSGISSNSNGVTVSEEIYDSVIQDEGNLTIAAGAVAEEMIVHEGGTVSFNTGSIAKGKIRTTGGTLTVESGADVSEAEFDFAVSHMDEANDAPLLNSLNNVLGAMLTITVVNGHSTAGKYVLAGDAAGFDGTLSVVGELNFLQHIGEGFEDGLIGGLGLDNTLNIEGRNYNLVLEGDDLSLVISAVPVITLTGDDTTPLQASTLTAEVDDGSEIFYSLDRQTWEKYTEAITVTENAMYYFKATDASGNTGRAEIMFENIDNTAPVITLTGDTETVLRQAKLTAATDDGSEIHYSLDSETWEKYTETITVTANATYFFKATDAAGNTGTAEISFGNIDPTAPDIPAEPYEFLINGETLSVQKDFGNGDVFDTITLTTEQLNSFEWLNAEEGVSITVDKIALENGKCDFALTGIDKDTTIEVELSQGESSKKFLINTLNSHLPEIRAEIPEGSLGANTPGDFFLSFINTRSIVKTDNAGNILYYRNEDSPDTQYGLWDFKTHQIDGRTYYSYHSTESHPESIVFTGHNPGERVIMDDQYNEIARIRAVATEKNGGDTTLDGHEFIMLGEDHYIVMSYLQVEADNIPDVNIYTGEPINHADKAILVATYIQEIDHGEVVFDWLSTEHPELYSMTVTDETEGAADFTNTDPEVYVDYVHLNAIVIDDDGNLVVSCRHLNSMIKIDRNGGTGNLMWVLSGVGDDFGLTDDRKTSGQHYLHYLGNGFFSAFNNNNDKGPTDLVLYHLNEDETALVENDGFRCWVVPGTTELAPNLPCAPHETYACGAFQLLGEYGVAGWGWNISGDELVTEFKLDDASEITFQLRSGYSKEGAYATYRVVKCLSAAPELTLTQQAASWSEIEHSSGYVLSVAHQGADAALSIGFSGNACDIYNLPNGEYVAKLTENDFGVSSAKSSLKVEDNLSAGAFVSTENGIDDLFFAKASGTWGSIFYAQHVGSVNDWAGTNELVSANGKNRLADLFFGSNDANILCLTDDENGDGIFVDDEFTELPEAITGQQARIAKIDEIRAGAGDDIVDMTSQQFEYIGDGLTIRGGEGNDVIWANKGDNFLFGDAGNDRVVGASGNDVIVGGSDNDRMHGGGGDDVFAFCDNWGADTVGQLANGKVTLWFASGDESKWNAETLTYTDGTNSVKVSGVSADEVTLKFGDDGSDRFDALVSAGAFDAFTSQKVFEDSRKGILAGL